MKVFSKKTYPLFFTLFLIHFQFNIRAEPVYCKPLPKNFPFIESSNPEEVDVNSLKLANYLYNNKFVTNNVGFNLFINGEKGVECDIVNNVVLCPTHYSRTLKKVKNLIDLFIIFKLRKPNDMENLRGTVVPVSLKFLKGKKPINFPREVLNYLDITSKNRTSDLLKKRLEGDLGVGSLEMNLIKDEIFLFNRLSSLTQLTAKTSKADFCILDVDIGNLLPYEGNVNIPTLKQKTIENVNKE